MFPASLFLKIRSRFTGSMHQWLLLSCAFSCLLVLARVVATGHTTYLFLYWNLFLAFVPYLITRAMMRNVAWLEHPLKKWLLLMVWLIFIPNSFYIITDIIHFPQFRTAPQWFDLLMLFSFAWNGIVCGVLSVRTVEVILRAANGRGFSLVVVFAVMWLNALGVYIGRYGRFNSWDVLADPFDLAAHVTDLFLHPFENGVAWGMTIIYAMFITLLYIMIRKMGESLRLT